MGDEVAVRGVVATSPRHVIPEVGAPVTSFRLITGRGHDGDRNWYTITATHELALSAAACVALGDPVVVDPNARGPIVTIGDFSASKILNFRTGPTENNGGKPPANYGCGMGGQDATWLKAYNLSAEAVDSSEVNPPGLPKNNS